MQNLYTKPVHITPPKPGTCMACMGHGVVWVKSGGSPRQVVCSCKSGGSQSLQTK